MADLSALWISLRLAAVTTVLLLLLCTPLAWWLATGRARWRVPIDAAVSLPLVLPPTVLGFYLLLLLGPGGWIGGLLRALGLASPVFSFSGLVIGSMFYSLPFVVQPLRDAFESLGRPLLEAAATLRASPWNRFFSVALPLAGRGFLTAGVLAFAHTLGEFGVVLMIGGNIPGRTQTASIAIFNHAEALEYGAANRLSATLIGLAFVLLVSLYLLTRPMDAAHRCVYGAGTEHRAAALRLYAARWKRRFPSQGVTALFGRSGSGKTTLLRCIAGLERRGVARICLDGELWQDEAHFVPTHRRALGYVFQEPTLFPHYDVRGNLDYALRRVPDTERRVGFEEAVSLLGLQASAAEAHATTVGRRAPAGRHRPRPAVESAAAAAG